MYVFSVLINMQFYSINTMTWKEGKKRKEHKNSISKIHFF